MISFAEEGLMYSENDIPPKMIGTRQNSITSYSIMRIKWLFWEDRKGFICQITPLCFAIFRYPVESEATWRWIERHMSIWRETVCVCSAENGHTYTEYHYEPHPVRSRATIRISKTWATTGSASQLQVVICSDKWVLTHKEECACKECVEECRPGCPTPRPTDTSQHLFRDQCNDDADKLIARVCHEVEELAFVADGK